MAMMVRAWRTGTLREVAHRDDANCLLVKTGWKFSGFMVA